MIWKRDCVIGFEQSLYLDRGSVAGLFLATPISIASWAAASEQTLVRDDFCPHLRNNIRLLWGFRVFVLFRVDQKLHRRAVAGLVAELLLQHRGIICWSPWAALLTSSEEPGWHPEWSPRLVLIERKGVLYVLHLFPQVYKDEFILPVSPLPPPPRMNGFLYSSPKQLQWTRWRSKPFSSRLFLGLRETAVEHRMGHRRAC